MLRVVRLYGTIATDDSRCFRSTGRDFREKSFRSAPRALETKTAASAGGRAATNDRGRRISLATRWAGTRRTCCAGVPCVRARTNAQAPRLERGSRTWWSPRPAGSRARARRVRGATRERPSPAGRNQYLIIKKKKW